MDLWFVGYELINIMIAITKHSECARMYDCFLTFESYNYGNKCMQMPQVKNLTEAIIE